jgi:signal transduction histidine kinase
MQKQYQLFTYFLHPAFRKSIIRHRKATILIFTHWFIFVTLVVLLLLSKTIEKVALVPALCALPLLLGSLFLFKNRGRIHESGNILTLIWYATLFPLLLKTGGINSFMMPWLFSIILIMVLVEHYYWATTWFLIASISCVGLYFWGQYDPTINISNGTQLDTLLSYLTIGFFMFANLSVFESHQVFVIRLLKKKNDELKIQRKAMADMLAELKKVQQELTATNQELQIFAYAASHDLKEPLRTITMYTQLIERGLKKVLDPTTKEYMFFVTDGIKRMQRLLDSLLAYSLLGKNTRDIKAINLNDKLKKVLQNLTVAVQESEAVVICKDLPTIMASETEMMQLFQNVIANALKFRKKDTKPLIEVSCLEDNDEYIFAISDNCIGIKTEDQERVFNLFTRLYAHTHYEGTGIGLATCKKILTKMNGKIWVTSTEGVGTTFHFMIPKVDLEVPEKEADASKTAEKMALSN